MTLKDTSYTDAPAAKLAIPSEDAAPLTHTSRLIKIHDNGLPAAYSTGPGKVQVHLENLAGPLGCRPRW